SCGRSSSGLSAASALEDETGRPAAGRSRHREPFAQSDDGIPVDVVVTLVEMRRDLELRRGATNLAAADRPARVERLARPEVESAVEARLPAVSVGVERERMEVELPPASVAQH